MNDIYVVTIMLNIPAESCDNARKLSQFVMSQGISELSSIMPVKMFDYDVINIVTEMENE